MPDTTNDTCLHLTDNQLARVVYSLWDFNQANSALTFLLEECEFNAPCSKIDLRRFRCYETTLIVAFARPFEAARGKSILGLKALGLQLDEGEASLKEKVMELRRKTFAHSDDEMMHYRGVTFQPFDDADIRIPHFVFDECLQMDESEYRQLSTLLHKLIGAISLLLFRVAQCDPERLQVYKRPGSTP